MRRIDALVVHCSATRPSQNIGAADIRKWHTSPPRNWADIGYHRIIRRDGTLEYGRTDNRPGAHVAGHNAHTLAVCLVGGVAEDGTTPHDNFTPAQMATLLRVLMRWKELHPNAEVKGHRDFPGVAKACPSFDARAWWQRAYVDKLGTVI